MDSGTLVNFALVLFFVLLGGVFAGTEMALISLRESQVRRIEKAGRRGAKAAALARNPNRFLSTVQIGVTLSGFFSAAYGASTISPDIEPVLERVGFGAAAEPVAFIGMTLLVAYLSLVLGELVPKRLAMQSAVGFTRVLAPPLVVLSEIMRPVIWLLSVSTDAVVKLFGGDPHAKREGISSEELWDMVAESDLLEESSRHILTDVFGAGDRTLQEVMRPRTEVTFIDGTMSIADARSMVRDGPYSRFPVIGRTPDDVLGFVHIRDLMPRDDKQDQQMVKDIVRELLPCREPTGCCPHCPGCAGWATTSRWWWTNTAARTASSRWKTWWRNWWAKSTTNTTPAPTTRTASPWPTDPSTWTAA